MVSEHFVFYCITRLPLSKMCICPALLQILSNLSAACPKGDTSEAVMNWFAPPWSLSKCPFLVL